MRKLAAGLVAVSVVAILAGRLATGGATLAQTYPPPVGSLSVEATFATATTGGTSDITATVLDESGNPVEGAEVVFRIASQPGDDARWANGGQEVAALTDANGVATVVLSVGNTPGSIVIETISGAKTSQVTLTVEGAPGGLPPTGALVGGGDDGGVAAWQIAFLACGAAVLGGGLVIIARRNRRA